MLDNVAQPSSKTKTVAINTVSQLAGKLVSGGITFAISLIIAHMFGSKGYGDFTKITTYVAVFYLFADFGINAIYLKNSATDSFKSLISLRFIMAIIFMMLALAIMSFLPGNNIDGYSGAVKIGIILFIPTILFQAFINTANAVFQKNLRYDLATVALVGGALISVILVYLSGQIFQPEIALPAMIVSMATGLFITAILAVGLSRKFNNWSLNFSPLPLKELFFSSLPLGMTLISNVIYFRADSFILTLTRTTEEVGIYGFAYKLFEFILVFPTFFMNAVYPLMVRHNQNSIDQKLVYNRIIKKSGIFLTLIAVISTGLIWIFAPWVSLVRPEFVASILPLRILALGLPAFFLSSLTMWMLISVGKQSVLFLIYLVSMIFNIMMNLFFIPKFGYMAAAIITDVSELIVLVFSLIILNRPSSPKPQ
jgi:O-antigen/teichoic acid export membrane protein